MVVVQLPDWFAGACSSAVRQGSGGYLQPCDCSWQGVSKLACNAHRQLGRHGQAWAGDVVCLMLLMQPGQAGTLLRLSLTL